METRTMETLRKSSAYATMKCYSQTYSFSHLSKLPVFTFHTNVTITTRSHQCFKQQPHALLPHGTVARTSGCRNGCGTASVALQRRRRHWNGKGTNTNPSAPQPLNGFCQIALILLKRFNSQSNGGCAEGIGRKPEDCTVTAAAAATWVPPNSHTLLSLCPDFLPLSTLLPICSSTAITAPFPECCIFRKEGSVGCVIASCRTIQHVLWDIAEPRLHHG